MIIISFLSVAGFTIYCLIGIFYLFQNYRSIKNIFFFLFCLSFALWSLSKAFLAVTAEPSSVIIWQKIGYTGALTYDVFILLFFIHLTGLSDKMKKSVLFYMGIWILPLVFLFSELFFHNIQKDFPFGFWYIGLHVLGNGYNFISIIFILVWINHKTETGKEARYPDNHFRFNNYYSDSSQRFYTGDA